MTKGDDWESAQFRLPRGYSMPVEVELTDGTHEMRISATGDWRKVTRWQKLNLDKHTLAKLRKAKKLPASEADA